MNYKGVFENNNHRLSIKTKGEMMKVLDLDMDYFMNSVATGIDESIEARLDETDYGESVWNPEKVREFLEKNLGLSTQRRIKGRIVKGHNEALLFWKELLSTKDLTAPFEVVHVDSHADLGLGYSSWLYIFNKLLRYPVEERPNYCAHKDNNGDTKKEGIGDYLLFAIAYRWISKLTYCSNPKGDNCDFLFEIIKNFEYVLVWDDPVDTTIQLLYNEQGNEIPRFDDPEIDKKNYISRSVKEPEVPFRIIPTIEAVEYNGDFDYISLAQSPNYTPESADFIMDIFKEYIVEI